MICISTHYFNWHLKLYYNHGSVHRDSTLIRFNKMKQYAGIYLLQNFAINKHLHTVASHCILLILSHDSRNHEYKNIHTCIHQYKCVYTVRSYVWRFRYKRHGLFVVWGSAEYTNSYSVAKSLITLFPWSRKFTSVPFGYVCVHRSRAQKSLRIYMCVRCFICCMV